MGELYGYVYVSTALHTQRLRAMAVSLRTETQTGAGGSGRVESKDLEIRAKPEVRNQSKPTNIIKGEERAVTLGERFRGRYATLCYQADSKNSY